MRFSDVFLSGAGPGGLENELVRAQREECNSVTNCEGRRL